MNKVIRHITTQAFLQADGSWTHDFKRATIFPNIAAAIAAKTSLQLEQVELVYIAAEQPSPAWDFSIPLR